MDQKTSLEEKPIAEVLLRRASDDSLPDGELLAADVRPSAERRLVRMLDMRLLPTIIVIFIMNYIDVRGALQFSRSWITMLTLC